MLCDYAIAHDLLFCAHNLHSKETLGSILTVPRLASLSNW